jgi:hypothetical protein
MLGIVIHEKLNSSFPSAQEIVTLLSIDTLFILVVLFNLRKPLHT